MTKLKPVWRMNTGKRPPRDLDSVIMVRGGGIYDMLPTGVVRDQNYWTPLLDGLAVVYAYQTTRTKAAKYERKHCWPCDGLGHLKHRGLARCPNCNGTGTARRKINGN